MRKPSAVIGEALLLYSSSRQFLCHIIDDHFPHAEVVVAQGAIMDEFPENISLGSHLVNFDPVYRRIQHDADIPKAEKETVLYNIKRAWFLNLVDKLESEGR